MFDPVRNADVGSESVWIESELCVSLAVEFHAGEAGAANDETAVPFTYATYPSLQRILRLSDVNAAGLVTLKGMRKNADEFTDCIAAWRSSDKAGATTASASFAESCATSALESSTL